MDRSIYGIKVIIYVYMNNHLYNAYVLVTHIITVRHSIGHGGTCTSTPVVEHILHVKFVVVMPIFHMLPSHNSQHPIIYI